MRLEDHLLLYAVADRSGTEGAYSFVQQVKLALQGGATMIQLKGENLTFDEFLFDAVQIKKITEQYNIPLIIYDNIDIAQRTGADGVHVSNDGVSVKEVRGICGADKIIGVSVKTVKQAKAAQQDGADYISVGAVTNPAAASGTPVKSDTMSPNHSVLKKICRSVSIPTVAAGGINRINMRTLTGTYITGVAVGSALFAAEDIESAARKLLKLAKQTVIRGAIFDLDGTLIDSMPYWKNIAVNYLKSIGAKPKSGLRDLIRKMSLRESVEYVKKEYALHQSSNEIMDGINGLVSHYYYDEILVKPGVKELLKQLQGVKKCVCTLSNSTLTRAVLQRNGILNEFDDIISAVDFDMGKDTPEIYELARQTIGTEKKYTYIFEDSDYAIKTAKKGGFTVIGVHDAHMPQEKIEPLCDFYTTDYENWI